MRRQITVDIFAGPGATIDATAALEVADRHGVRDRMARLLPYAVAGPAFVPGIHQQLTRALASLHAGRVDDAEHHLNQATQHEPQTWKAVQQPRSRPGATPTGAANPAGSVHVHTYPPVSAARLAASYTFQSRDHAAVGVPYFLAGGNGMARSTWRQRLRATTTGSVAVVAISSQRHADDQVWRTVAAQMAATVDNVAPWVAVRRPQPDSLLVFVATGRPVTAATRRHIVAVATTHLLAASRPGTPPPNKAATATPPRPPAALPLYPPRPRRTR